MSLECTSYSNMMLPFGLHYAFKIVNAIADAMIGT